MATMTMTTGRRDFSGYISSIISLIDHGCRKEGGSNNKKNKNE
jgi:hypothetical protein